MTKTIIDNRTPDIILKHKLRPTWETASPLLKQDLMPPPAKENYPDEDAYAETLSGWTCRTGRILGLREQAMGAGKNEKEQILKRARNHQPENKP